MNDTPRKLNTGPKASLATVGLGVLAVVCCAGAPLIVGALGSIAVGGVLGVGVGALTVVVVSAVIVGWIRHRHACAVSRAQGPAAQRRGHGS